jgi:hypothetical protein
MNRIFSSAPLICLMLLTVGIMIQSCNKSDELANHAQAPSSSIVNQRSDTEWVITYHLDEDTINLTQYSSLDTTWYYHDVVQEASGSSETPVLMMERRVFSSKSEYENWGSLNGVEVGKMLDYEDRLRFVADSSGISANDSVPTWYSTYAEDLYIEKFGEPENIQYLGSRFFVNSCNPATCSNASFFFPAFVLSSPTWGHFNPLAWFLDNNAEAWEPERLSNGGAWSITLRPYPNAFFIKWPWQSWRPRTTTVRLAQGVRRLFVPFTGPLSMWSNRISSWLVFP